MAAHIEGFDWDAANVGHILLHAVTPFEVEEAAVRPHVTIRARAVAGEERKLFRTVTAYPMNAAERRKYGSQIDWRSQAQVRP